MTDLERTISFEAIDDEDRSSVPYQDLRFTIQPPIQVHDPSFLDKAIWREIEPNDYRYHFGDFPYVKSINVTYSDEDATHGIAVIHAAAEQGLLEDLLTNAFARELNPLGKFAIRLNFSLGE